MSTPQTHPLDSGRTAHSLENSLSFGKINREMVKTQTVRRPTWRPNNCRPTVWSGPRIPITCAFLLLLLLSQNFSLRSRGVTVISKGKEKREKRKNRYMYRLEADARPPHTTVMHGRLLLLLAGCWEDSTHMYEFKFKLVLLFIQMLFRLN
jgi:hypothetical protein